MELRNGLIAVVTGGGTGRAENCAVSSPRRAVMSPPVMSLHDAMEETKSLALADAPGWYPRHDLCLRRLG